MFLDGTGHAVEDRVNGFQVGRVGRDGQTNVPVEIWVIFVVTGALVVFDIPLEALHAGLV